MFISNLSACNGKKKRAIVGSSTDREKKREKMKKEHEYKPQLRGGEDVSLPVLNDAAHRRKKKREP